MGSVKPKPLWIPDLWTLSPGKDLGTGQGQEQGQKKGGKTARNGAGRWNELAKALLALLLWKERVWSSAGDLGQA